MRWDGQKVVDGEVVGGPPTLPGMPGLLRSVRSPDFADVVFHEVAARSVLNAVPGGSAVPFRWTVNTFRGCSHACVYCFARPTHEYLGFGIGEDFDRRIVIKVNAVERLRAELRSVRWRGEAIAMGTNTDPYQPVEGRYRLTQGIIETLAAANNPFSILTKSTLIGRDTDLLVEATRRNDMVHAALSIGCLDEDVWRATEPHTPHPLRRMETVARLNEAGVPCGVMIAPVLPGISDSPEQLEAVVRAAIEAGATSITPIMLHLRRGVRDHYLAWLAAERPELLPGMRERYRTSYGRDEQRRDLGGLVRRMVERHGGPRPQAVGRFGRRGPAPAPPPSSQMTLM